MAGLPFAEFARELKLHERVTCVNCWNSFTPETVEWISVHPTLAGEVRLPKSALGIAAQQRFIAERFDPEGRALDSEGSPCTQLACPACRLSVPRASLEMPSLVFSLLGAPGSGKSVFLTSMTYTLRQVAASLGLQFLDADLVLNKQLVEDERKMFLHEDAEQYRPIDQAVEKTKEDDQRYRTSLINGHSAMFVPPFTFLVSPGSNHPNVKDAKRHASLLCLYDNAGEHFRPGEDTAAKPMTRHLKESRGLMYTFDPTRDRRVRKALKNTSTEGLGIDRQDLVLIEAANRIRDHAGISATDKIDRPLVVVLTKFDDWKALVPVSRKTEFLRSSGVYGVQTLQLNELRTVSRACGEMLRQYCPEIVTTAESLSDNVTYVPVAAVGWDVRKDPGTGRSTFRAAECEPFGVLVPLLSLLQQTSPKLVFAS